MLCITARIIDLMIILTWVVDRIDPVSSGHTLARNADAIETALHTILG